MLSISIWIGVDSTCCYVFLLYSLSLFLCYLLLMKKNLFKMRERIIAVLMFFLFMVGIAYAQDTIYSEGWTYKRYGEKIGLLGNRFIAFIPDSYDPTKTYRIIVIQHGAGGQPEDMNASYLNQFTSRGIRDDVIVIAPHLFNGDWRFNSMDLVSTQEFFDHLHKIRRDYNTYEKVYLTGFSMGGQFVISFTMHFSDEVIAAAPGGYGGGVILPSGNYYCHGDYNNPVKNIEDMCYTDGDIEACFNSILLPADQKALEIPWFAYHGEGEGPTRMPGHILFTDSMEVVNPNFHHYVFPGIGHDVTTATRDSVIDLYKRYIANGNTPPVATANISQSNGLTVSFDATGSTDSDGTVELYKWEFGDGNTANQATVSHTYASEGKYIIRLRVTDNDNDIKTVYKSIEVSSTDFSVNNPSVTYALHLNASYNAEYEFNKTDFTASVTDEDGDPIQMIRINSLPLKGTLKLNGVDVTLGQEIPFDDIPFLAYTPVSNEGEDFMEYNVYDGHTWSVFDDSRINIMIEKPTASVFTNINPASGNSHVIGTLEDGTYYYTNEQSAIAQGSADYTVPAYLKGQEIIRTNSLDKGLKGENTLSFDVEQDVTLYIAFEGGKTPPAWISDSWTFHSDSDVYSWFYFDLYKKEVSSGATIQLGGNQADPSTANRMYFVIGVPNISNELPVLHDTLLLVDENTSITMSLGTFEELYQDRDGDPLSHIQITRLPVYGSLQLNGVDVVVDQLINTEDIDDLSYIPQAEYIGFDNFKWNASDGTDYAAFDQKIHIEVEEGTGTSVFFQTENSDFDIHPNPASKYLNLSVTEEWLQQKIYMYDSRGQIVLQKQITGSSMRLDISSLSPGFYVIRCLNRYKTIIIQ